MDYAFKKIYIVFILFLCCPDIYTNEKQDATLFVKAGDLYARGNIEKAYNTYSMIEEKTGVTLFNMAVCSYQLEQYIDALIYWRRAQQKAPQHYYYRIQRYIDELKKEKLHIDNGSLYNAIVTRVAVWMHYIPLFYWQLLFLFLWIIVLGLFYFGFQKKMRSVLIVFLLALLFNAFLLSMQYLFKQRRDAVVINNTQMYAGKHVDFSVITDLVPGQEVAVREQANDWLKVRHDDHIGWVPKKFATLV